MDINFDKLGNGLVPAIIQDAETSKVLMLGFMNQEAFEKTEKEGKVTFFSRTKNRLWTKGEESGNFLKVVSSAVDCANDVMTSYSIHYTKLYDLRRRPAVVVGRGGGPADPAWTVPDHRG